MSQGETRIQSTRVINPDDLRIAANKLPPSPQVFGKLGKLLRDADTSLNDITDLVNTDSSLTTRVLKLSNSAAFAQDMAIDNLDDAINRIGFREVFKLVGMAAASDLFSTRNATYGIEGSLLWENALSCGLAMEFLAQKFGHDEQDFYTLGLLRSMGKMVIDICLTNSSQQYRYPLIDKTPLLEWEENSLGITNPAVAGFLLSSWNFSNETVESIQQQYLAEASSEITTASRFLNFSGSLAEGIGRQLPGESVYWKSIESQREELGFNESDFEEALETIEDRLNGILNSVAS